MKTIGRLLLGGIYLATPIFGWIALWNSFKRVKANEVLMLQHVGGSAELIENEGIYFRPFPGDTFSKTYKKTENYIDFGPLKRVRVQADEWAYKRNAVGQMIRLNPGIHTINVGNNEVFDPTTDIKKMSEDYVEIGYLKIVRIKGNQIAYKTGVDGRLTRLNPGLHEIDLSRGEQFDPAISIKDNAQNYLDFGAKKIVRIMDGQMGVKIDSQGRYIQLPPGIHEINAQDNETFMLQSGIQEVGSNDFSLGSTRYVTIRNGELGESYKNGIFCLLEPGQHALKPGHSFVKRVSVEHDVVDLGAYKIITVKEGQVAVINTREGVVTKGPGKHEIKQEEGNFFNALITTSPQGVELPILTVMCSDQIEMRVNAMLIFQVMDPLKTVGLGIDRITGYLKKLADGILRSILSRFSSADIAPSLHIDDNHDSAKRTEKLNEVHDALVKSLDEMAKEWGLCVKKLNITEILPADELYHKTIRDLGSKQSTAEANKRIAENEAKILSIQAKGEQAKVIAAEIARDEAIIRAETDARIKGIATSASANQTLATAESQAKAMTVLANAESNRIRALGEAAKELPEFTQQVLLSEAQGKILSQVKNPVFVQPGLGDTTVLTRENNGLTLFSTAQRGRRMPNNQVIQELQALHKTGQSIA